MTVIGSWRWVEPATSLPNSGEVSGDASGVHLNDLDAIGLTADVILAGTVNGDRLTFTSPDGSLTVTVTGRQHDGTVDTFTGPQSTTGTWPPVTGTSVTVTRTPKPQPRNTMPGTLINPNRSGTITIGPTSAEVNVQCQIHNIVLNPSVQNRTVAPSYCPDTPTSIPGTAEWTLEFTYAQDWGATDSLSELLFAQEGNELDFTITPADTSVPVATGKVIAQPGPFGGGADEPWVSTGTLSLSGRPTFTAQP